VIFAPGRLSDEPHPGWQQGRWSEQDVIQAYNTAILHRMED